MATRFEFKGGAVAANLSSAIDAAATSFTIDSTTGWPNGLVGPFVATLDTGLTNEEKILCASRSGNVVTVSQRGYDNTTAAAHAPPCIVRHTSSAKDFDLFNDHMATTSRDDHTQYVHNTVARTVSANHTFSGALVLSGDPTFTGSPQFSTGTPAFNNGASFGAAGSLDPTTKNLSIIGPTSNFGAGATGGTGTYVALGDASDANGVSLTAKGTPANVTFSIVSKGTGGIYSNVGSTTRSILDSSGLAVAAFDSKFGIGAFGATGTYVNVSGDSATTALSSRGTLTNISMVIYPKGTGSVRFEDASGNIRAEVDNTGDTAAGSTALRVRQNNAIKRVEVGAADSGGSGYRLLRIVN